MIKDFIMAWLRAIRHTPPSWTSIQWISGGGALVCAVALAMQTDRSIIILDAVVLGWSASAIYYIQLIKRHRKILDEMRAAYEMSRQFNIELLSQRAHLHIVEMLDDDDAPRQTKH